LGIPELSAKLLELLYEDVADNVYYLYCFYADVGPLLYLTNSASFIITSFL